MIFLLTLLVPEKDTIRLNLNYNAARYSLLLEYIRSSNIFTLKQKDPFFDWILIMAFEPTLTSVIISWLQEISDILNGKPIDKKIFLTK